MTSALISTQLKPLQAEARDWLAKREATPFHGVRGGMFLDDPGMGKTLSLLSLIALDQSQTTLVVCPSNVISVWHNEIAKHTTIPPTRVMTYHGARRASTYSYYYSSWTSKPLIILTSYGIVRNEFVTSVSLSPTGQIVNDGEFVPESLFVQAFDRIILDEAHFIKEAKTKSSISISKLTGICKWVVTATPLANNLDEDFPYFRFLGMYTDRKDWRSIIPQTRNDIPKTLYHKLITGTDFIKGLKGVMALRRDKSILSLPAKTEQVLVVQPSEVEAKFYKSLYKYAMDRIGQLRNEQRDLVQDKYLKSYCNVLKSKVLVLIIRLKQACINPWMVIQSIKRLKNVLSNDANAQPIYSLEEAAKMLDFFNQSKNCTDECTCCLDATADTIAKPCGHKLCKTCWDTILKNYTTCPYCRTQVISVAPVAEQPDLTDVNSLSVPCNMEDIMSNIQKYNVSSKMQQALQLVKDNISATKIIIVSQWNTSLDYMNTQLIQAGFAEKLITRIDGGVSLGERDSIIKNFQTSDEVRICLISLTCSAEGITLTRAKLMIYLDQWWNQLGKTEQMNNRIHRIGRDSEVKIIHLRVNKTIENRIEQLHQRKNKIVYHSLIQGQTALSLSPAVTDDTQSEQQPELTLEQLNTEQFKWMNKVRLLDDVEEAEDIAEDIDNLADNLAELDSTFS